MVLIFYLYLFIRLYISSFRLDPPQPAGGRQDPIGSKAPDASKKKKKRVSFESLCFAKAFATANFDGGPYWFEFRPLIDPLFYFLSEHRLIGSRSKAYALPKNMLPLNFMLDLIGSSSDSTILQIHLTPPFQLCQAWKFAAAHIRN